MKGPIHPKSTLVKVGNRRIGDSRRNDLGYGLKILKRLPIHGGQSPGTNRNGEEIGEYRAGPLIRNELLIQQIESQ